MHAFVVSGLWRGFHVLFGHCVTDLFLYNVFDPSQSLEEVGLLYRVNNLWIKVSLHKEPAGLNDEENVFGGVRGKISQKQ